MIEGTTQKTATIIQRWIDAQNTVNRAKRELLSAETELNNATNSVGDWIAPPQLKAGEWFNLWFGSGIVRACKPTSANDFIVEWLKKPDGKQALEMNIG